MPRPALLLLAAAGLLSAQPILFLPSEDPAEGEHYRRLLRSLEGMTISVDWREAAFADCLRELRASTSLPIQIHRSIDAASIPPITLALHRARARSVVAVLAESAGVVFQFRHGAVFAISRDEALKGSLTTRVHDIRELLYIAPDFPAPRPAGLRPGRPEVEEAEPERRQRSPEEIVDLVRLMTAKAIWDHPDVAITADRSMLVVRQSPEAHREVERALRLLRGAL
jgi:hypothetical protein